MVDGWYTVSLSLFSVLSFFTRAFGKRRRRRQRIDAPIGWLLPSSSSSSLRARQERREGEGSVLRPGN